MNEDQGKRHDVLKLALDVHGAHTGSFPDLSDERLGFAKAYLEDRLANWSPASPQTEAFDSAVRTVLALALQEARIVQEIRAAWKDVI